MSTTAQEIFDLAMGLMDSLSSSGSSDTSDNTDYKNRTLPILNTLRLELFPLSDTYTIAAAGTRPTIAKITALSDVIALDDFIAQSIMPYGLAATLLVEENPSTASFFQQRYEELKNRARYLSVEATAIEDVYGGVEHTSYSAW